MAQEQQSREPVEVERVQTGVRMEKRMLKVLKALAEQRKGLCCMLSRARRFPSPRKR
jgi:hypothetical protein